MALDLRHRCLTLLSRPARVPVCCRSSSPPEPARPALAAGLAAGLAGAGLAAGTAALAAGAAALAAGAAGSVFGSVFGSSATTGSAAGAVGAGFGDRRRSAFVVAIGPFGRSARRIVALGLVGRCHRDVHRLAFEQRCPFRDPVILDPIREPGDEVPPDLRMGQFAASEAHRHLDPVAILEELDGSMDLGVEVADADLRREADFLEGHRTLLALGFLLALRQFVLVLPEIEELDHRRRCHRGDFDEVEPPVLRHLKGFRRGHHTQLGTLFIDHPDLRDPDHLIHTQVSADGSLLVLRSSLDRRGHTTRRRPKREDSTWVLKPTTSGEPGRSTHSPRPHIAPPPAPLHRGIC